MQERVDFVKESLIKWFLKAVHNPKITLSVILLVAILICIYLIVDYIIDIYKKTSNGVTFLKEKVDKVKDEKHKKKFRHKIDNNEVNIVELPEEFRPKDKKE